MKSISILFFVFFISTFANAATVTVNDGDQFNFDAADTYIFTGALSSSNPIVTYGVNIELGESFNFLVNAPAEFDLGALMSTGPNGTGTGILDPNGTSSIAAGTSFLFPVTSNGNANILYWLSLAIGTEAYPIIDDVYGGSFGASEYYSSSVSAVPLPAAAFLFAPALLGLMGLRKRASSKAV